MLFIIGNCWSRDTAESFTSDAQLWIVSDAEKEDSQSVEYQVALQGWARGVERLLNILVLASVLPDNTDTVHIQVEIPEIQRCWW